MKRIMIVPALFALWAQPALADEYYSYESYRYEERSGGGDYWVSEAVPAYRAPYVADGYIVTDDEPSGYGANCEVEQEWRRGTYRETIECEED